MKTVPEILETSSQKVINVLNNAARYQQFSLAHLNIQVRYLSTPTNISLLHLLNQGIITNNQEILCWLCLPHYLGCTWELRQHRWMLEIVQCRSLYSKCKGFHGQLLWMAAGRGFGLKQLMISMDSPQAG